MTLDADNNIEHLLGNSDQQRTAMNGQTKSPNIDCRVQTVGAREETPRHKFFGSEQCKVKTTVAVFKCSVEVWKQIEFHIFLFLFVCLFCLWLELHPFERSSLRLHYITMDRDKDQDREGEYFCKLSWQPSWILNHQIRLGNLRPDQKRSQDSFSRFVFISICLSASVHYFCCVTVCPSVSLSPTKSPEGNKVHKCRTQSQSASWGGFCLQQFLVAD